jgi:GTP 3',8-cyclase
MPAGGIELVSHHDILSFEEILRFVRAVKARFGLGKVRITGGDPLVRPQVVDLVAMLAREDIPDLALTTNAQWLADTAHDLKEAGLRRVNISLDSLDEDVFAVLTRGGRLQRSLDGIAAAVRCGLTPVKLNTIVLRGYNDAEVARIARFAFDAGCHVRFLELMPIGCAARMDDRFVPSSETRARLERHFSLSPLSYTAGASSRDFVARDAAGRKGVVGFISAQTEPFCSGCRRLRLTSTGSLVSCLAIGRGVNVRDLLKDPGADAEGELQTIIDSVLAEKRVRECFCTPHSMAGVGG